MAERFAVEQRWPELFAGLDANNRRAVVQSFASAWQEGWVPNREDVENLTDEVRDTIDGAEYLRRVAATAERRRAPRSDDSSGREYRTKIPHRDDFRTRPSRRLN